MKITSFFALFVLSAFISYPSTTAHHILDFEGAPIENEGTYYLMPIIWAWGGGIEIVATGKETCPLTVVQSPSEVRRGLPIRISSLQDSRFIPSGSKVRIGFAFPPECAPSPWWTIVEGLPEGPAVKLGGYKSTLDGWFEIEKVSSQLNGYKLLFCEHGASSCENIGIYDDEEGNRRLVLTEDNPLMVGFVRATSSNA